MRWVVYAELACDMLLSAVMVTWLLWIRWKQGDSPDYDRRKNMDLEKIYDDQIAPLMTHIIAIAKEHNMPFVFSFQLTDDEEEGPLMCTSCLLPEGCSEKLVQAKDILYAPPSATTLTLTARNAEGAVTAIEHILFKE